ncbi:MAG: hypothetical protein PS018_17255 [bacterium]|nr:hypothetical protein [bacterium]
MSMWVRLVGGHANGQVKKIDDDQIEIVLRENLTPPTARAFSRGGLVAETIEYKLTRYTRREIRTPGGTIHYFAIDGLSDFEALQHVLGP